MAAIHSLELAMVPDDKLGNHAFESPFDECIKSMGDTSLEYLITNEMEGLFDCTRMAGTFSYSGLIN